MDMGVWDRKCGAPLPAAPDHTHTSCRKYRHLELQ